MNNKLSHYAPETPGSKPDYNANRPQLRKDGAILYSKDPTSAKYDYRSRSCAIFDNVQAERHRSQFNSDAGDLRFHAIGPFQASPFECRSGDSDPPDSSISFKGSEPNQLHVPRLHPLISRTKSESSFPTVIYDLHGLHARSGKGSDIPTRSLHRWNTEPGQASASQDDGDFQRNLRDGGDGNETFIEQQARRLENFHAPHHGRAERQETESQDENHTDERKETPRNRDDINNGFLDGVYDVPEPQEYRGGVLSQLLQLYKPTAGAISGHHQGRSSTTLRSGSTKIRGGSAINDGSGGSRTNSPVFNHNIPNRRRKWYEQKPTLNTIANLVEPSIQLANPSGTFLRGEKFEPAISTTRGPTKAESRPVECRNYQYQISGLSRMDDLSHPKEKQITEYLSETLTMQDYIIMLCRTLMLYGAPTHRLEEYMATTARFLHIDGQFLYLPGCMIISFGDRSTHTTKVSIVRTAQGIDLGKLKDAHRVYKEVMHDVIRTDEAIEQLEDIISRKEKFSP